MSVRGPPRLFLRLYIKLLNFDFNPDPAFDTNADPDLPSKNNADPDPQLCIKAHLLGIFTLRWRTRIM